MFRKLKTIAPAEAARAVGAGELQLVDVRPAAAAAEGRVAGAVNIPLGELEGRIEEIDASRPVAFMCRSGMTSKQAVKLARARGLDALNVDGGANAWKKAIR